MACIDKTYVNAQQFKEAVDWAKKIDLVTLENGRMVRPLDWIYGLNAIDDPNFDWNREEYILWNTPMWLDRWLWLNCPLDFVKERIKFQYDKDTLKKFEEITWANLNDKFFNNVKHHYKFLKEPCWHDSKSCQRNDRKKNPWPGKCQQLTYFMHIENPNDPYDVWWYDRYLDMWYPEYEYKYIYTDHYVYVWQEFKKNIPCKKTILRMLRKWNIPKGYIVKLRNSQYRGIDYEIMVK